MTSVTALVLLGVAALLLSFTVLVTVLVGAGLARRAALRVTGKRGRC